MRGRGISTIGRSGVAALVALAFALLALPAAASADDGGISGTVTLAVGGAQLQGVEVCAETEGDVFDFECAETAADGSYEITGLSPAKYLVFFEAGESGRYLVREYYDDVHGWYEGEEVTVASGLTTPNIDAALEEGGAIAGTVTDAVDGTPLGEVLVCSWREDLDEAGDCAETATDGTYEIVGVPTGSNGLEFLPFEWEYEPKLLNGIVVGVGAKTANVNAALSRAVPPDGRIGGHVYAAATHQPLGGIAVCAIDEFDESRGCAHTSKAGAYEFVEVPAEPWRIAFSPAPGEFEAFAPQEIVTDAWPTQFWNLKPTLAQADVLNVTHGSAFTGIDALLGPGAASQSFQTITVPLTESKPSPTGAAAVVPTPVISRPPTAKCPKGKVKKRVKGKRRCVKRHQRHKPRHHKKRHHRR